ncbi:STE20/SPS1-related proline-alanine-rich protein kinase [Lepeophtheirus salmonis]|uniref:STE20/SPS1-related proline-alanine-rich protein kinase n=1 Tax=Lepeophtheirus salmonis TaxID=72036 RepID=UPI001AE0EF04|nr:STE20/SPS1-related proline-alanine-rich protein kinase-like [Lepeophtheirus salmonis]
MSVPEVIPAAEGEESGSIPKSSSSVSLSLSCSSATSKASSSIWPNSPEDYELREVIGVGATAVVHAALCKPRNEKCAIKRINLEKWNTSMDELLKEIQAMSSCNHENVVTYFTSFVFKEELWLVLRLLNSGSLLDIIRHKLKTQDCKSGVLDEVTIATVLKEVLRGLEYLHNNGHIHRDIKAGNILLGSEGQVQIADFGVSAWLVTGGEMNRAKSRHTFVGTPCWMAPEVMEQVTGYDYKADIWSFGITAVELATGTAPYHKYPPMKVLMLTLQNEPPTLDTNAEDKEQYKAFGKTFRKMISECLQKDPSKRPTATELLKHQFFKSKAKDRKYLQQNIIASAPTIDSRSQKIKNPKRSGTSGRLHKNTEGDWVWSSDEDDDDDDDEETENPRPKKKSIAVGGDSSTTKTKDSSRSPMVSSNIHKTLNLVLRMRNPKRELNDIRFEYQPSKDTAEGIANELLGTSLIGKEDLSTMALNLKQLVTNPPPNKVMTFRVVTGFNGNEEADEKSLLGFAQLSLTD